MTEEFDPGRVGFREKLRGPSLAALPHEMAILERYTEHWSRLWAITYDPTEIIPDERTMGWWLLAEFKNRQDARVYMAHLAHVFAGRTIRIASRRKQPSCPACGCTVIKAVGPDRADLACDDCGERLRAEDLT